jgi:hypothetical protein
MKLRNLITKKERKAALKKAITFAKNVWKEYKIDTDVLR